MNYTPQRCWNASSLFVLNIFISQRGGFLTFILGNESNQQAGAEEQTSAALEGHMEVRWVQPPGAVSLVYE